MRSHQPVPAETRACTLGLQIGLDAGLRFDAKKAVNDAVTMGRLSPDIHDQGVRRAARAIARNLTADLTADDSDDRIAQLLADLHKACAKWQS